MLDQMIGRLVKFGFESSAFVGRFAFPHLYPENLGLEVIKDIPYQTTGSKFHLLDVYRPQNRSGLLPTVLYIHGGGFRILSKDTHWIMAQEFAVRNYVVFNINYRLAPLDPFPAGLSDCAVALEWIQKNAERFGADPNNIIIAGESAGGNLSVAVNLLRHRQYDLDWARPLYENPPDVKAVLPGCGLHQVSGVERFQPGMASFVYRQFERMSRSYLPDGAATEYMELADPVRLLENADSFERELEPHFVFVGGGDSLVQDSERLHIALKDHGAEVRYKNYAKMPHAFHAAFWLPETRECWRDQHNFLDEVLAPTAVVSRK